jgi:hypothetical protein
MTKAIQATTGFAIMFGLLAGYFAMVAAFWGGVF